MQQHPVRNWKLCVDARTPARPRGAGNALGARGNRQAALTIAAPAVVVAPSTVAITHDDAVEVLEGALSDLWAVVYDRSAAARQSTNPAA